jgi:hypothetical protein
MLPTTHRTARLAAGLVAATLSLSPLAGCSSGSDNVSCSGKSCTVKLSGKGAKAEVLGYTISYTGTQEGRATVQAGSSSASCTQGQTVSAGPLRLQCSTVTADAVELKASLG